MPRTGIAIVLIRVPLKCIIILSHSSLSLGVHGVPHCRCDVSSAQPVFFEQYIGIARGAEAVSDTDVAHKGGVFLCEHLCDGRAESPYDVVFLCGDDSSRLLR